jgi:hypothetical protein
MTVEAAAAVGVAVAPVAAGAVAVPVVTALEPPQAARKSAAAIESTTYISQFARGQFDDRLTVVLGVVVG